ncbi:hypothetical protein [Uliginosibacterium sp. 31-12]|uniref:hypothetical protein n=1 Tax=Uliginosibacterium sp. 31-12 TaxID=3062781 RepID=UPI0026E1FEAF|nr:hypothetical protein [Uliginosibacterium sp. 31-12]MDO6387502.1 hypothetical protein [Uliginosibacterium sp. 31-12]
MFFLEETSTLSDAILNNNVTNATTAVAGFIYLANLDSSPELIYVTTNTETRSADTENTRRNKQATKKRSSRYARDTVAAISFLLAVIAQFTNGSFLIAIFAAEILCLVTMLILMLANVV